ncbi:MAG: histidine kinase N-terminal 7TM domain-containing protein, partial [Rubrobacteraceae bacterium]
MSLQTILYSLPMLAASGLAIVLAFYTWSRRSTEGAVALTAFILAIGVWSLGAGLGLLAPDMSGKLLAVRIEYLGIVSVPPTWLVFVSQYTGLQRNVTRFRGALLFVVPVLTWLIFATNDLHGLMWRSVELNPLAPVPSLVVEYGPWFWFHSAYSYLLILIGAGFLVSMFFRAARFYRLQSTIFLIALLIPMLANASYILRIGPILAVDPTPFGFAISGVLVVWGLFRFRMLDILPIARNAVIENMKDGVIVIDLQNRVVDLNPAAQEILGYSSTKIVGQDAGRIAAGEHVLLTDQPTKIEQRREIEAEVAGYHRDYELTASELRDIEGKSRGRLILLQDVTERKQSEEKLRQRAAELAISNAELENFASFISHDLRAPL